MQTGRLTLVLAALTLLGCARALTLVISTDLSYFFGNKPPNNVLCYTTAIRKPTILPVTVTRTDPNGKAINFVTINAEKYSPIGFTVDMTSGQLGTSSIGYKINGPIALPYAIIINMYCTP
ncbi:uncharacterized protein LOC131214372 [Anopheles bellator]|uniref:uncharacterized protein LOC131214372 n=1 Tax=Anopheles bellator TaxID=139047 RepID=UPI0026484B9E|nr:uncharacterized protein LOC131214372 [Anopheles bellator]